jgi:hypothetical protein
MRADRITLAFFIDALGWELAKEFGCFRDVAPHWYRQRTILGYSCAAQPTILTGLSPAEHGHWAMFYRSERSELASLARLRVLPTLISSHRRFRRHLLTWHRKRSGFTGYYNFYRVPFAHFRQFDIVEKRDIYSPRAFEGDVQSLFDRLAREGVPYRVWNWRHGLDRAFEELGQALDENPPPRFALLYTAEMDALLHGHIGDSEVVARALLDLEGRITKTVQAARERCSRVDVLIFSDHGMIQTMGSRDMMGIVARLGLHHGRDCIAFYDSTMARFWFRTPETRTLVERALGRLDWGTILSDDDLRREGVYFDDRRFGELIFLANPGMLIVPSHMGAAAPRGMHGFTPDHDDSYAILMSNSPISPEPARIADTFAAMRDCVF